MRTTIAKSLTNMLFVVVALTLSVAIAVAQSQNRRPQRPPLGHARQQQPVEKPKGDPSPLKEASQEDVVEAVLGNALVDLYEQADEHFHKGEYNHSVNLFRLVVQGDPENLDCYLNAAYLLWSTDRNDEAIDILKQGIGPKPANFYLLDKLGRHYLVNNKNPKAALPYLQKAVTFPCPFFTWNSLATCYEKLNQWDKAVETWKKATELPDDPVAQFRLEQAKKKQASFKKGQSGLRL